MSKIWTNYKHDILFSYPYWQYTDLFIFRFVSLLCFLLAGRKKMSKIWINYKHDILLAYPIFFPNFACLLSIGAQIRQNILIQKSPEKHRKG